MSEKALNAPTVGAAIEGSYGTVVFGNGVPALTGEVVETAYDHIVLAVDSPPFGAVLHVIPLPAIVYYRYADER